MFPDFPKAKRELERRLTRLGEQQITAIAPLLAQVRRYRQHEGRAAEFAREVAPPARLEYPEHGFEFTLSRDEMKNPDPAILHAKIVAMAKHFAETQMREMIDKVSAAAEEVGNTVDGGGRELTPEILLETLRRVQMEFDPNTEQVSKSQVFLMHPSMLEKYRDKFAEWNEDPAMKAEHDRIMQQQLEAWRVRESRRALVD